MKKVLLLTILLTSIVSCATQSTKSTTNTHFYPIHYKDFDESNFPPQTNLFNTQEPVTVYFAIPPETGFGEKSVSVYFQNIETKQMVQVDTRTMKDGTRAMFHINRGLESGKYTAIVKSGDKILGKTDFSIQQ